MSEKWETVGPSDGLGAFIPGPDHYIVRDTDSGVAKEVYVGSGQEIGDAIANAQFTDRDVSVCNK